MVPFETLILFIVTTFVVVLSPGPAAIAVTAESASNGFKRSLLVILGIALANVAFFILSATGIAALLIGSGRRIQVEEYIRVAGNFNSGKKAWAYVCANTEKKA